MSTKATGNKTKWRVKGFTPSNPKPFTKANSSTIFDTAKEHTLCKYPIHNFECLFLFLAQMAIFTKVSGRKARDLELESSPGPMAANTKVTSLMESAAGQAALKVQMERFTKAIGRGIRSMVRVSWYSRIRIVTPESLTKTKFLVTGR